MAFFPSRVISELKSATLISVFYLSGQCLITGKDPVPVWETAMPLPSIYPAHNVTELTLVALVTVPDSPPLAAGDFFQVSGIFFFQIETNLAPLELQVHVSCASSLKNYSHHRLPLTIPAMSYLCFCPMRIFFLSS